MWAGAVKREIDRGVVGAWARRARLDAGYTSSDKAAVEAARRGVELNAAYLRGVESGAHKPSREFVLTLAGLYGAIPPADDEESERWLTEIRVAVTQGVAEAMDARMERQELLLARLERLLVRLGSGPTTPRPQPTRPR